MLSESAIHEIIAHNLASLPLDGKRVLLIVPDLTRTMPMPLFFRLLMAELRPRVSRVDVMVALGTHPPLDEESLLRLVGLTAQEYAERYADVQLLNHAWSDPDALITLGTIPADEIAQLSDGLLRVEVPVRLNRRILDYDELIICGPVFPHEVVGISGGNKYFFPGIAGPDIIHITHWLGALITSYTIIGVEDTPVRRVIDRAAAMIPRSRHAFCSVVTHEGVDALFFGTPEEAHAQAAKRSAQVHIRYVERPYKQVLSILPTMYDELWVGSKGMYKMEPVVADGGELIIYAPHLHTVSLVHGAIIREIGYHVRDYFVKQWDRFKHLPWGILAHSTHLRGIGTYENGIERPRINVTLATGIPADECRAICLGYRDPTTIDPHEWMARNDPDLLVVPRAGETLYRLK